MVTPEELAALRRGDPVPKGKAACRYERGPGPWKFRDCVYVYRDGRLRLERSCGGEAACVVFSVWSDPVSGDGTVSWKDLPATAGDVPQKVTGLREDGALFFDGKPAAWACTEVLESDSKNGYRKKRFGR